MNDEQFKQFMDMQFAHLCVLHGIFNCIQAANIASSTTRGNVGGMQFKDAKKILENAIATRQQT